jgi:uncharacterized membrane protein
MGAKVAAFLITLVLMVIFAVVGFVLLVMALNSYGDSESTYAYGVYGLFAFLLVFGFACLAGGLTHLFLGREFKPKGAATLAMMISLVVGVIALFICIVIGIGIAEWFQRSS